MLEERLSGLYAEADVLTAEERSTLLEENRERNIGDEMKEEDLRWGGEAIVRGEDELCFLWPSRQRSYFGVGGCGACHGEWLSLVVMRGGIGEEKEENWHNGGVEMRVV